MPISSSNRTFMELKWSRRPLPAAQSFSSNRTFMELKFIKQSSCKKRCCVLIAPLWNWNGSLHKSCNKSPCSNRTFMELKFIKVHLKKITFVRSNRTFMELKFLIRGRNSLRTLVLIAPLWNWNLPGGFYSRKGTCSNRTFMELKWGNDPPPRPQTFGSNRTFMELKFANKDTVIIRWMF